MEARIGTGEGIIKIPEDAGLMAERRREEWYQPWISIARNRRRLLRAGIPIIEELGRAPLPTEFGDWTKVVFGDHTTGDHHEVLAFGNIDEGSLGNRQDILARLHSACRTNEVYHATNCECREELHTAMKMIAREQRGLIVYLAQEGRGTGIAGKMKQLRGMFCWKNGRIVQNTDPETGERIDTDTAYRKAGLPSECRDFTVAAEMLKALGVESVRLLTNNPAKIKAIREAGIGVIPVEILIAPQNSIVAADLRSKALNLGHTIPEINWTFRGAED